MVWGRDEAKLSDLATKYSATSVNLEQALTADLVISTLPIGILPQLLEGRTGKTLLDIAYMNPANSSFEVKISGIEMLIWQAIGQLRELLNGGNELSDEQELHDLMLHAVKMEE
jgi:shikimate 5-dehydrogenase